MVQVPPQWLYSLLGHENYKQIAIFVLCHINMSDSFKSPFVYADCILQVMKLLLECSDKWIDVEPFSLCIHLAANPRVTLNWSLKEMGWRCSWQRTLMSKHPLLMKMIGNILQHNSPNKICLLIILGTLKHGSIVKKRRTLWSYIWELWQIQPLQSWPGNWLLRSTTWFHTSKIN